jgi:hypothetical protein
MSDYQTVTVTGIAKKGVTIEVVEESFDSRALSSLFDEGPARGIEDGKEKAEKADWLKIGAMLLLGQKAMDGDLEGPEDDSPTPEYFVADVTKIEASPIGEGNSKNTRYRAVLTVTLTKAKYAKLFTVGETFGGEEPARTSVPERPPGGGAPREIGGAGTVRGTRSFARRSPKAAPRRRGRQGAA